MRKILAAIVICAMLSFFATGVSACPMCKNANESDQANEEVNARPRAYMYSILFMLAMPATILGGYGLIFWRVQRAAVASMATDDLT